MMNPYIRRIAGITTILLLITGVYFLGQNYLPATPNYSEDELKERSELKKARSEYFLRKLRNPRTNRIPKNMRARELSYSRTLPTTGSKKKGFNNTSSIESLNWKELGPKNVGGRTRGLAVDVDDPNTIIAGGVSGGIWKSTDGGASWDFKLTTSDRLSVSWLIQDTTSANNDTWYYATGEYFGNSADATGASFHGSGVYQSTDNGETWSRISSTADDDVTFNSEYDYISRLVINPVTGSLFMCSNALGIYRFNDGTSQFERVVGGNSHHIFSDLTVNENGTLMAVLSDPFTGITPDNSPGVYVSTDDGDNWTDKTPASFPSSHERSFATFAPSAPDTAYVVTYTGNRISAPGGEKDEVEFHMFELDGSGDTLQTDDRTSNLPDFSTPAGEITQANYNMILSVKPDDPDFVLLGFTNLYRSRDAFTTAADNATENWIGGYALANDNSQYANHHPDQHALAFDPTNPDRFWSGHDGGVSVTDDITVSGTVNWQDKNNGYNVTQFYDVSIPDESGDNRVMGGTQDNGTPQFFTGVDRASQGDASSGDGGYSYFGDNYAYVSNQNGTVRRYEYNTEGKAGFYTGHYNNFAYAHPENASGQLFINPFSVDPNDETVIYYPAGSSLWRNTDLEDSPINPGGGNYQIDDWEELTDLSPASGTISAINISEANPDHRLVYGVYHGGSTAPEIYRIDNANTATDDPANLTDISISSATGGAYINRIAINPEDADEMIAVMSNYEITGLYHTTDGGSNWNAIEGNLEGSSGDGPSLRDAAIIPNSGSTIYMLATSTGVYSTSTLNGSSTSWSQEGSSSIGNVVATSLAHRTSDNTLVVGTHGRGMFGKLPKERLVDGNAGWRMMSAPVENMPISEITDDTPFQGFGDGEDKNFFTSWNGSNWTAPADLSGNLTSGKGFILYFFDNNQAGSSPLPHPLSADGNEPSGDVTVNLHASGDRFNLVGNPYDTPIDFDLVTRNDVENKWWVWDDATNQYYTYNGTTGVTEPENNGHIAAWQGVFVRALDGATAPSLTFSHDAKAHYNASFYKENTEVRTIRFIVEGRDLIDDNTVAVFYENGEAGIDEGDMEELQPLSSTYISLSFLVKNGDNETVPLANDARPLQVQEKEEFPMQLNVSDAGAYTMQWDLSNIPGDWIVELYDRKTERVLNLNAVSEYEFEAEPQKKGKSAGRQPKIKKSTDENPRFEMIVRKGETNRVSEVPDKFRLGHNYPNPFNPTTLIRYELSEATTVRLEVFNSIGQKVAVLVDSRKQPGFYKTEFDASNLASGLYFYRIEAGDFVETKSMTLIK